MPLQKSVFRPTALFLIENGYEPFSYEDLWKAYGVRPYVEVQWGCFENPRNWEVCITLRDGFYYQDQVLFRIGREASSKVADLY